MALTELLTNKGKTNMKRIRVTGTEEKAAMFLLFEHDWDQPIYRGAAIWSVGRRLHALCGGTEKEMDRMSADARAEWFWLGEKIVRKLQSTGWLYCDKGNTDYLRRVEDIEGTPMFEEWQQNQTKGKKRTKRIAS